MRELDFIEVKITPSYYLQSSGREDKELHVRVRYAGIEHHTVETLWNSDAISVIDYVFDRAKRAINETLKEKDNG